MILPDWFGNKKVFLAATSLGTLSLSQIRSWLFKGRETANQLIQSSKNKKKEKMNYMQQTPFSNKKKQKKN